jgi:hypothetical protein
MNSKSDLRDLQNFPIEIKISSQKASTGGAAGVTQSSESAIQSEVMTLSIPEMLDHRCALKWSSAMSSQMLHTRE